MYCPKGTAFLWASPEFQARIVPPVLSGTQLFSESGPNMAADFEYVGTRDYTNYAAVPAVRTVTLSQQPLDSRWCCFLTAELRSDCHAASELLSYRYVSCSAQGFEFRRNLPGGDEAAMAYAQLLARWAGKRLSALWDTEVMGINEEAPAWLINIRLPFKNDKEMGRVSTRLRQEFHYNMTWYGWGGKYWQRLSSQIYLDKDIIEEYAQRVLSLLAEDRAANAELAELEVDGEQSRL